VPLLGHQRADGISRSLQEGERGNKSVESEIRDRPRPKGHLNKAANVTKGRSSFWGDDPRSVPRATRAWGRSRKNSIQDPYTAVPSDALSCAPNVFGGRPRDHEVERREELLFCCRYDGAPHTANPSRNAGAVSGGKMAQLPLQVQQRHSRKRIVPAVG